MGYGRCLATMSTFRMILPTCLAASAVLKTRHSMVFAPVPSMITIISQDLPKLESESATVRRGQLV